MACYSKKFTQNIPGQFFVDSRCIDCDLCRQIAPAVFKRNFLGNSGHSYVYRQPANPRDLSLCNEALDACPVQAIGACKEAVEEFAEAVA